MWSEMENIDIATHSMKFQCPRCSRDFARREHLQRHERSHTKEKPFRCPCCPKAFTRKDLLSRHIRLTQHSSSDPSNNRVSSQQTVQSQEINEDDSVDWTRPTSGHVTQASLPADGEGDQHVSPPTKEANHSRLQSRQLQDPNVLVAPQYSDFAIHKPIQLAEKTLRGFASDFQFDVGMGNVSFDPFELTSTGDFATYMDSVPDLDDPFNPAYQPLPTFASHPRASSTAPSHDIAAPHLEDAQAARFREPFSALFGQAVQQETSDNRHKDTSLSSYGSRLPSLEPDENVPARFSHQGPTSSENQYFHVSTDYREQIVADLKRYSGSIDCTFRLPSRYTLSRFITLYFKNFHDHYPMFHLPTMKLETMNFDLVLAIAALGARYAREPEVGVALFYVSKAVVLERTRQHRNARTSRSQHDSVPSTNQRASISSSLDSPNNISESLLEIKQTLLLLIAISTWYSHEPSASDALSFRSILHTLTLEEDHPNTIELSGNDWKDWVAVEILNRTQLVIFCFFNIHTICYDLPPMMLAHEVNVKLPDSEREWKLTESCWRDARRSGSSHHRQSFQDALSGLYTAAGNTSSGMGTSALGGCALIHAVIQQIWLVRNAQLPHQKSQGDLSEQEMTTFERVLKRWTRHWEDNLESSMNPLNPHGPLTFTSTALLRLAYIRLHIDLGSVRCLSSWDATIVARSLHHSPPVQRSDKLTRAALHCAHALSIPVKLGIAYVAQTQLVHWSNQHALCTLECATLSAKWLSAVTRADLSPPLTPAESRVLDFTVQLIAETEYRMTCTQIMEQKQRLSGMTVRLWARLYQASSVWQMVALIGQALNIYADLLFADGDVNVAAMEL